MWAARVFGIPLLVERHRDNRSLRGQREGELSRLHGRGEVGEQRHASRRAPSGCGTEPRRVRVGAGSENTAERGFVENGSLCAVAGNETAWRS